MLDFLVLAEQCAPTVHMDTMRRIVQVESAFNPFAIGVVNGRLDRQPRTLEEAISTAKWLEQNGFNYSVGLAQVNKANFRRYGLTLETAFEPCPNLKAGGGILTECFLRARKSPRDEQTALRAAFSCYYSGNFITGYREGYVVKVVGSDTSLAKAIPVVPKVVPQAGTKAPAAAITVSRTAKAASPAPATPKQAAAGPVAVPPAQASAQAGSALIF
ncbi:transglycosylase SLT domain-containing protein [Variovorax sp. VaC1]|uniref:lytic transglycosylase domain-containing protein n=1 Tax=Variovorax sp. VaC1 TaxID=3373132 RepID=UPI00374A2D1D